jgi:hypothetical protein
LTKEFPQIDYSSLDPVYPDKTSTAGARYKFNKQAVVARAQSSLHNLYNRPEKVIVVVSHAAFLRQGVTGHWFYNADYRIFDFDEKECNDDTTVNLRHWDLTRTGGLGLSWEGTIRIGEGLPE